MVSSDSSDPLEPPVEEDSPLALQPKKYRRMATLGLVVVIAVGIAVVVVASSRPSANSSKFVLTAANVTTQQKSANITLSLSAEGLPNGEQVTGSGTGVVDFQTGAFEVGFAYGGAAQGLHLRELFVDEHFYETVNDNGQGVSTVLPGKQWIELPIAAGSTISEESATQDPAALLKALSNSGNTVTSTAPQTVDGVQTKCFLVAMNPASLRSSLAKAKESASLKQAAEAFLRQGSLDISVCISPNSEVLRTTDDISFHSGVLSGGSINVTMDYSDFGTPVSISAPSPTEVASLQQFESAAKSAGINNS